MQIYKLKIYICFKFFNDHKMYNYRLRDLIKMIFKVIGITRKLIEHRTYQRFHDVCYKVLIRCEYSKNTAQTDRKSKSLYFTS